LELCEENGSEDGEVGKCLGRQMRFCFKEFGGKGKWSHALFSMRMTLNNGLVKTSLIGVNFLNCKLVGNDFLHPTFCYYCTDS
jgi:hypothetical protein